MKGRARVRYRSEVSDEEAEREVQRVSRDLVAFRADLGVNHWGGYLHPTMLIWAGRVFDFLRALEDIVGFPPARRQSYTVGYRSGRDGAEANRAEFAALPPEEGRVKLLLAGNRILVGAGWGRCAIEYDSDAGTVMWDFPAGTAVAQAARLEGPREEVACPFLSGYIAGWTNVALGTEIEVQEVECVARDDPRCRFESRAFLKFGGRKGGPSR